LRKFVWERKEDISGVVRERDAGKGENPCIGEREREKASLAMKDYIPVPFGTCLTCGGKHLPTNIRYT
jgi:hypothetical protein